LIGCLAAIYPAFRLSGFKIVNAVKGKLPAFGEGKFTRKFLLCFQLTVASFVLISSVIMAQQFKFIQQFDLGYTQHRVLVITSVPREWSEEGISKIEAVKADLLTDRSIISGSVSYEVPDGNAGSRYNFYNDQREEVDMPLLNVDESFAKTFDLKLIAGNFFHDTEGSYQSNRVVLNEEAVRSFGWTPESAIGNQITYDENEKPLIVTGVIKNFHFSSLFESVRPISLIHIRDKSTYRYLSLKLDGSDHGFVIERVKKKWAELFPQAPFDCVFMEDKLNQFYAVEKRMYKSTQIGGLLTIIITVSGLVAFMSINLARRIKEIGIRKIHGASPMSLVVLLGKDFLLEFIISGVLACVSAYYFITSWLSSFHYRIELPFYTFFVVHLCILVVICLIITVYSLSTVRMKPVNSLRYE
jgi:putative ABC transport system permease protein